MIVQNAWACRQAWTYETSFVKTEIHAIFSFLLSLNMFILTCLLSMGSFSGLERYVYTPLDLDLIKQIPSGFAPGFSGW